MFHDRAGKRRPIARMGAMPALYYDRFCRMDDVIGWGGQLGSFEAVFSPLDPNGQPLNSGIGQPEPSTRRSPKRGKPMISGWYSSATGRRSAPSSRASST